MDCKDIQKIRGLSKRHPVLKRFPTNVVENVLIFNGYSVAEIQKDTMLGQAQY